MIEIIQMDEAWTGRVAELEKVCFSTPWSEQSIAQELHNPLSLWLLAVEGESLAGYVGSQTVMGETDMMNLAVAPQRRRQGIGRRLVEELTARLARMGSRSLTLECGPPMYRPGRFMKQWGLCRRACAGDITAAPGRTG